MKLFYPIRVIRIWRPTENRIRHRYFFKSEILFGSDQSADIHVHEVPGLDSRLDFVTKEIHIVKTDELKPLEPGELFQIGTNVFQWKEVILFKPEWKWTAVCFALGLVLISGLCFWGGKSEAENLSCSSKWIKFESGRWQAERGNLEEENFFDALNKIKTSFKTAIKEKAWAKARAEIVSLNEFLESQAEQKCTVSREIPQVEAQLSRALVGEYIKDEKIESAAEEALRFRKKFSTDHLDRLETRIIKAAGRIYFAGYRMEDEDADKASDLMEQADRVCKILGREPMCFKGSKPRAKAGD